MATVITVVGVTALIYEVLERDYGVPRPEGTGTGNLGTGTGTGATAGLTQAQVQTLIDASIAAIPAGTTDQAAVEAIIEAKLTEFAPMIQQAIQSQFNAMPDRIRLNVTDPVDTATIEVLHLSGPSKVANLNFDLFNDGTLSVKGKRVLTVDDALEAAGGGIDQAAVEGAVAAATAAMKDRIDGLENQVRLLTQYIDQQVGTVVQYADMELAKKADETALTALADKHEVDLGNLRQAINDTIELVLNNYLTKRAYQELMDAMNGPNATTDSIKQMFWLLNDVVMALIEATGIEIDGRVKP
jgi:hypothetical protein